ncbi:hypothetical protein HMPREF0027_0727 [Actinobacillus ureae ATCC 25976]|uniref:Type I restriction modification DNA specificity domain-containing protein n=1 Tax=Actinobacillus ureae ATCC 25976 TaxID=887324 RepID=E8KFW0_9PAST|nr:restriction endonuclease subunit S [Actinobacillus ureae]EFX92216.1 hypothetical protein HMPREF0027_0727 [Actinobacillus ureae ATCC 25976]
MNRLDISNWKEFKISELFITETNKNKLQVPTGAAIAKKDLTDGDIPRVTVTNMNNGIVGYYKNVQSDDYRVYENFISVSFLGTIFYHPYQASLDMKVHCLKLKERRLNNYIAFFLISIIKKQVSYFAYNDQLPSSTLTGLSILLPVKNNEPDWEYMENYIKRLYFIKRGGISTVVNYVGKPTTKRVDITKWGIFQIGKLFEIKRPDSRSIKQYEDGSVPFVSSGNFNNGIDKFVTPLSDECLDRGNCITISPVDGSCFYQPTDFLGRGGGGSSIILLYNDNLNEKNGMFISTILRKTLSRLYEYNDMGSSNSIKQEKIKLPATANNQPDWEYMENYISYLFQQQNNSLQQLL